MKWVLLQNFSDITSGSLNGLIYGTDATSIGGKFQLNGGTNNELQAVGVFKGQKQ